MCMGGGGGDGSGEMRRQEDERQERVRQSINKINEVFGGPVTATIPVTEKVLVNPGSPAVTRPQDPRQPGQQVVTPAVAPTYRDKQIGTTAGASKTVEGQFGNGYFDRIADAYKGFYQPQVDNQFKDAREQLQLAAARRGAADSSSAGESLADLYSQYEVEKAGVAGKAGDFVNQQRGALEDQRQQLVSLANTGVGSEQIANMAATRAQMMTKPPEFSPLGDLFQKATSVAANSRLAADAGYRPLRPLTFGGGSNKGGVTTVRG